MKLRWLLTHTGRWHAWPARAPSTLCGTLNIEDLRRHPAREIVPGLEPQHRATACRSCLRQCEEASPAPSGGDDATAEWLGYLRLHAKRMHVVSAGRALEDLASMLGGAGRPTDKAAQELYDSIRILMLTPMRVGRVRRFHRMREALDLLRAEPDGLIRIGAAMLCWRTVVLNGGVPPREMRWRPDAVIKSMLQVPNPEPYVRHCAAKGLQALGVMWHPNVVARAKRDASLRGVFNGGSAYWDRTKSQLKVIR